MYLKLNSLIMKTQIKYLEPLDGFSIFIYSEIKWYWRLSCFVLYIKLKKRQAKPHSTNMKLPFVCWKFASATVVFFCDAICEFFTGSTLMDCFEKVAQNGPRLNLILLSQKHGSNFSHFKFVNYWYVLSDLSINPPVSCKWLPRTNQ